MMKNQLSADGLSSIQSAKLFSLFASLKDRSFIFVEPGGNFGDKIIYMGAEKIARHAGLSYKIMGHEEFMASEFSDKDVIYIHGGGGYVPFWSGTPILELERSLNRHHGVVIQGPQTFYDNSDFIEKKVIPALSNNVTERCYIFTRERGSFDSLKNRLPTGIVLEHDHDTALNLTAHDLGIEEGSIKQYYDFFAIRKDKEAVSVKSKGMAVRLDPIIYCNTFEQWIEIHARARKIVTNRLHSSILGTILGKQVTLLANSYHKNHSVWKYSLESRGVAWGNALPERIARGAFLGIRKRVSNSYKVNKIKELFYRLFFRIP